MPDQERQTIVSVTAAQCRFDYYRGSGAGGQHRNKTSSAVRCTHEPSGAVGQAEDTRSQHENKRLAFGRMARSDTFQRWIRIETAKRTGAELAAKEAVERALRPSNLIIEGKDERGRWSADAIMEGEDA
jgi:protein subunit release factor B